MWKVNGRVESEIKNLEAQLLELEDSLLFNYFQEVEQELLGCKQQHVQWLHREDILGCQKSQIKWLTEGNLNTSFFPASLCVKKKNK